MTGSSADAEDIVQETFRRAIERPPRNTDQPWAPWLVRVATNLARDALRRRKRRGYVGPWLPAPIETTDEPPSAELPSTEGRYDLMESVTFAFLLALEVLTPRQRAVLLLRDVFDFSVEETGRALRMSEANVKTTLHRARHAMEPYDHQRSIPNAARQQQTEQALSQFLALLVAQDVAGIEAMLAKDVVTLSDGGGEFHAALLPVRGRSKVARFYLNLARKAGGAGPALVELRRLNGLPAVVLRGTPYHPKVADRVVIGIDLDGDGAISRIHTVIATPKLTAVRFPDQGAG
jgi:RNA polymerase sigma-70 factor (ECF subfamily)